MTESSYSLYSYYITGHAVHVTKCVEDGTVIAQVLSEFRWISRKHPKERIREEGGNRYLHTGTTVKRESERESVCMSEREREGGRERGRGERNRAHQYLQYEKR